MIAILRAVIMVSMLGGSFSLLASSSTNSCYKSPLKYLNRGHSPRSMHLCDWDGITRFCTQNSTKYSCQRLSLESSLKKVNGLRVISSDDREVLATFMSLMRWQGPITENDRFLIKTGRYQRISLSVQRSQSPCYKEVLQTALLLQTNFPDFNFSIDGQVTDCDALTEGVEQMVLHPSQVKSTIRRFHSPLHTVFFTNRTRFNHFMMQEMGLHLNANDGDEIKARLIENRIGLSDIPHERKQVSL